MSQPMSMASVTPAFLRSARTSSRSVSYTHLDVYKRQLETLLHTVGEPMEKPKSADLLTICAYAYVSKLGIQLLLAE